MMLQRFGMVDEGKYVRMDGWMDCGGEDGDCLVS